MQAVDYMSAHTDDEASQLGAETRYVLGVWLSVTHQMTHTSATDDGSSTQEGMGGSTGSTTRRRKKGGR